MAKATSEVVLSHAWASVLPIAQPLHRHLPNMKCTLLFLFSCCLFHASAIAQTNAPTDTTVYIVCGNETKDLTTLFDTTGFTMQWNTPSPHSAGLGTYPVEFTNSNGSFTVNVSVQQKIAVWKGWVNHSWHTAANWTTEAVPDNQTHVIIPTSTPECRITGANAEAASIQTARNSSVSVQTGRTLAITSHCNALPPMAVDSTDDSNMLLGNPTAATGDTVDANNYLMVKPYYTVCYNRSRATPNWVSWHVGPSDLGSTPRQDNFRADSLLPAGWYRVNSNSYNGSGFDKGHNCPSADRTQSVVANSSTFLMTNMIPQAPNNNQQTWAVLEDTVRELVLQGNEVYIVMGSYGIGGTGSNGSANTINNGRVTVPAFIWKVVVVLQNGSHDLSRITAATRVIAVITPNINTTVRNWKTYRVSVDDIETATGYDLLSNISEGVQAVLESTVDGL